LVRVYVKGSVCVHPRVALAAAVAGGHGGWQIVCALVDVRTTDMSAASLFCGIDTNPLQTELTSCLWATERHFDLVKMDLYKRPLQNYMFMQV